MTFGPRAKIAGKWFSDDDVAFTATLPATEKKDDNLYWRAVTFNIVHPRRAGTRPTRAACDVPAGNRCSPAARSADPGTSRELRITIRPEDFRGNELLSPGTPTTVDQPATVAPDGRGRLVRRGRGAARHRPVHGRQRRARAGRRDEDQRQPADRGPGGLPGRTSRACTPTSRPTPSARRRKPCSHRSRRRRSRATRTTSPRRSSRSSATSPSTTTTRTSPTSSATLRARSSASRSHKRGYCLHYASTMAILLRAANPDNRDPDPARRGLPAGRPRGQRRDGREPRARTPGSRSTSRATAGSRSTRPVPASGARARSRPGPSCRRPRPAGPRTTVAATRSAGVAGTRARADVAGRCAARPGDRR